MSIRELDIVKIAHLVKTWLRDKTNQRLRKDLQWLFTYSWIERHLPILHVNRIDEMTKT